mgnify:CR=1 FL=1
MVRTVYVNGDFVSEFEARISIFDRGFLFADSVYEVITVLGGKLVDWFGHVERLERSLNYLNIIMPYKAGELLKINRELIKLNNFKDGLIYIQISRGLAERDFLIKDSSKASLIIFHQEINLLDPIRLNRCLRVITVPEVRWKHRDIKTTQLLGASMAKTDANTKGVDDAWFVENEFVTEGTSSNAFIVIENKKIVTRKIGKEILAGVTRFSILETAEELGLEVEERQFSVKEAELASEAFITSSTNFIASVGEINGNIVGSGKVGTITKLLREQYLINIKRHSI